MIDELYKLPQTTDPVLQKIISYLYENALGVEYSDTNPTEVPKGKLILVDTGAEARIYYQSADGTVRYASAGTSIDEDTLIKAFVCFNGLDVPSGIEKGYNVSSLVDDGLGLFTVNYTANVDATNAFGLCIPENPGAGSWDKSGDVPESSIADTHFHIFTTVVGAPQSAEDIDNTRGVIF